MTDKQQQGKPQAQVREYNPIDEMSKAIRCLALELPEPVWKDVNDRWQKVVSSIPTEVQKEEWISVEQRLPENVEWCNDRIIFLQSNGIIRLGCYDYEFGDWTEQGGGTYKDITHWRPLPAPPNTVSSAPPISHKEDEK